MYRRRFSATGTWRGKEYGSKEVAAVVAEESDRLVVVTVFVFYLDVGGGA